MDQIKTQTPGTADAVDVGSGGLFGVDELRKRGPGYYWCYIDAGDCEPAVVCVEYAGDDLVLCEFHTGGQSLDDYAGWLFAKATPPNVQR